MASESPPPRPHSAKTKTAFRSVQRRIGAAAFTSFVEDFASGRTTLAPEKRGRFGIPRDRKLWMAWAVVEAYRSVDGVSESTAAVRAIQDKRTTYVSGEPIDDGKHKPRHGLIFSKDELLRYYRTARKRRGTDPAFREDSDFHAAIAQASLQAQRDGVDAFDRIMERVFGFTDL